MSTTRTAVIVSTAIVAATIGAIFAFGGHAVEISGQPEMSESGLHLNTSPDGSSLVLTPPVDDSVVHVTSDAAHQAVIEEAQDEATMVDAYLNAGTGLSSSESAEVYADMAVTNGAIERVNTLLDQDAYSDVEKSALHDMATAGLAITNDIVRLASNSDVRSDADDFVAGFTAFMAA